jgi:hypothetical protein
MSSRLRLFAPLAIASSVVAAASAAHAEAPGPAATPLRILAIDSDDAIEQSEAITNALRSRISKAPSVSLVEDGSVLAVLTTANKCDAKPDAKCEEKIGTKLGADRYIWGLLAKPKGQKGQVEVELHYWRKGQPDKVLKKSWSDNLKDAQDPALAAIAKELIDELLELKTGTVTLSAKGAKELLLDGARKIPMEADTVTVEVLAGAHLVKGESLGKSLEKNFAVGANEKLAVVLEPVATGTTGPTEKSSFPVKKAVGVGAMVGGGALLIGGAVGGIPWLFNGSNTSRDFCISAGYNANSADSLNNCKKAKNGDVQLRQALYAGSAVVGAGLVAVGAYLTFAGGDKEAPKKQEGIRVTPLLGTTNGLSVSGAF